MAGPRPRISRTRAFFAGGLTGLAIACLAGLILIGASVSGSAYLGSHGMTPAVMVLTAIPGLIAVGSIFAFPTSAAMVFVTTALSRRSRLFDNALAWVCSGALFSLPTAYVFSTMEGGRIALISIGSLFLLIGAISGLVAWLFGRSRVE